MFLASQANITCSPKCHLWSGTADANLLPLSASSASKTLGIPLPPPETIRFSDAVWNGQWNSNYLREQAIRRSRALITYDPPLPDADDETLLSDDATSDTTFRRVHVIPYQGDILAGLVKLGQKCRDIMIRYSRITSPNHRESLPSNDFDTEFKNIVEEFEELRATGITPLAELQQRHGPGSHHMVLQKWIFNTARVLLNMPAQEPGTRKKINKIRSWLIEKPVRQSQGVTMTGQDYPPRIKQLMLNSGYWDELPKMRNQLNPALNPTYMPPMPVISALHPSTEPRPRNWAMSRENLKQGVEDGLFTKAIKFSEPLFSLPSEETLTL